MSPHDIANYVQDLQSVSYIGLFLVIVVHRYVIPFPEDILLLLIGYVAGEEFFNVWGAIIVTIVGIVIADMSLFYLSLGGAKIAVRFERKIKVNIFDWYTARMKERSFTTIFISRFVPGFRMVIPLVAGFVKINPLKFGLYTSLSIVVYTPIVILVGFFFHSQVLPAISKLESIRHAPFVIFILIVGVWTFSFVHRRFLKD